MLLGVVDKIKGISFDPSNLDDYVASLRGLSEIQARTALSYAGLDKAQKQQILNKLAETSATVTLTSAEATEALTRTLGSKAEAEALLVKSGLVTEEELLAGTTIEVTSAELANAVTTGNLTKEEEKKMASAIGMTGTNVGLAGSFKLLTASIWEATAAMVKWLFTTPIGWAVLATAAVVAAGVAYSNYKKEVKEARQEMIETSRAAAKLEKDLNGLVEQYRALGEDGMFDNSDREEAKNIQEQINELLGDEFRNINLVNGTYEDRLKLLRKIQLEAAKENHTTIGEARDAARANLMEARWTGLVDGIIDAGYLEMQSEQDAIENLLKKEGFEKYLGYSDSGYAGTTKSFRGFYVHGDTPEELIKSYEDMIVLRDKIYDQYHDEIQSGGELEDFYNGLKNKIDELSGAVTDYKAAIADYNINEAVIQFNEAEFDGITGALIDSEEKMVSWINSMLASEDVSSGVKAELIGLAGTHYPKMSKAIEDTTQAYYKNKYATSETTEEINEHVYSLEDEAKQCGLTRKAYIDLITQEIIFNNHNLDVTQKIAALQQIATQAGITADKMREVFMFDSLQKAYNTETYGIEAAYRAGRITKEERDKRKAEVLKRLNDDLYKDEDEEEREKESYKDTDNSEDKSEENEALDNYLKDAENRYKIHQNEDKYIQELQHAYDNLTKSEEEPHFMAGMF